MNGPSKSNDPDLWNGEKAAPTSQRVRNLEHVKNLREVLRGQRQSNPTDPWAGWEPGQA